MPRDSSGNTTPLPGTIVSIGDTILPSQHNPMVNDVYAMMTQSLSRDGQGGMRANLDMSGFRIANLAAPTLSTDAARFGDTEPARTFAIRGTAYTAVVGDKNSVQRFTATVTCSLDPASTLGNGWYFTVQASGGSVTIDPNGSETINGASTLIIPEGSSACIWGNGTAFFSIGDGSAATGTIEFFARSTPPAGWLKANGTAVARSSYPSIDAALYVGDGNNATALFGYRCTDAGNPSTSRSTTGAFIVLPDMRGEFPRAWDDGRGVDAGRAFGTAQLDQVQDHGHNFTPQSGQRGVTSPNGTTDILSGGGVPDPKTDRVGALIETGGGSPRSGTETRPRNISLLCCMKI